MKKILISLIKLYRLPEKCGLVRRHNTCLFYPSCSEYTILAIEKYGSFRGLLLGLKRILRCHPWNSPRVDQP